MYEKYIFAIFALFSLGLPVSAYTIDGDLSDWGVTPFTSWAPSSPTADYTEDNWAHGSDIGSGSMPSGGETFDLEAIYFDDDGALASNGSESVNGKAYFAVVTSMPPAPVWSAGYTMGDLALDIDNDGSYEYGIKILGSGRGMVCHNPKWKLAPDMGGSGTGYPYEFSCDGPTSNVTGYADVAYVRSAVNESSVPATYVIEIGVWKSFLGSPAQYQMSETDVSLSCGNDLIQIGYDWDFPAPAFPAEAVPVAIALFAPVAAFVASRKKAPSKQN
jgi:hypothetical protein